MITLKKVKGHLRIIHNLEDEQLQDYLNFAKSDVIEAVFDSRDPKLDIEILESDPSFQKAVIILTTYYYENRLMISEINQKEAPFAVTHAIQILRAHRDRYYEVQ